MQKKETVSVMPFLLWVERIWLLSLAGWMTALMFRCSFVRKQIDFSGCGYSGGEHRFCSAPGLLLIKTHSSHDVFCYFLHQSLHSSISAGFFLFILKSFKDNNDRREIVSFSAGWATATKALSLAQVVVIAVMWTALVTVVSAIWKPHWQPMEISDPTPAAQ